MQQKEIPDQYCPDHQEKIISVQLSEAGEKKIYHPQYNTQRLSEDEGKNVEEAQQVQDQYQLKQYKLIGKKEIIGGYAMTINQDQTILVNSSSDDIQIWNFSSDGQLYLKQKLTGHTSFVHSLHFSKKGNMFISGSWDKTIRIWLKNDKDQWLCTQTLKGHEDFITNILLDNEDDQLISCSEDKTIKIWMRQKDNDQWKCVQTLIEPWIQVFCISLSCDCNQLASTGYDGLRIWSKGSDKVWKKYQLILNLDNDLFLRIKYINNNELIVTTKYEGKLIRFIKNNSGLYEFVSQLQLNLLKEDFIFWFPIIYNQQLGLVLLRHSTKYTYILKKQNNGEFIIHQVLNGNYISGYITKDGRICILHEFNKQQREIWQNE